MGGSEEEGMLPHETEMNKEQSATPEDITIKQCVTCSEKRRAVRLLIAAVRLLIDGLILGMIIGLIVTLIDVRSRLTSCHLISEVGAHSTIIPAAETTEIRNQKSAPCEDDWIWYRGKCYYFSTESDTWRNSEKFCISHNSSLAIIESKEELDFLFRYKGLDNHWIGMRRTDDNTAWIWTDGSLYNESLSKIRRSSHENIEHVYLDFENLWSDGGNFHYKWICNKK